MNAEFELVIPAYNESKSLERVIRRAANVARTLGLTPQQFQLIVVNNGSTDDSATVLDQLKETVLGNWFRVVSVAKNQGYGNGIFQGLRETQAPYVGWTHADMQCDPADAIAAFRLVKVQKKLFVKGFRRGRNWKDRWVTSVFEWIARKLLNVEIDEINAQPKVFERELLFELKEPPRTFAFDVYVLYRALKAGYTLQTIPVAFPPRIHGASKWAANFFSRYKTILGMIRYLWRLRRQETV